MKNTTKTKGYKMAKQQREKIGNMPCNACKANIDVKAQKNGVAYAHCSSCGIRHTGGIHSPEPLGGLEHHGAKIIHLEQTTVNMNGGTVNGSLSGDFGTVKVNNVQTEKTTGGWWHDLAGE